MATQAPGDNATSWVDVGVDLPVARTAPDALRIFHTVPAETTPFSRATRSSVSSGIGLSTSVACRASAAVTVVAVSSSNLLLIWPVAVAVNPSTETNVPTAKTTPRVVNADRISRAVIALIASLTRSDTRSRDATITLAAPTVTVVPDGAPTGWPPDVTPGGASTGVTSGPWTGGRRRCGAGFWRGRRRTGRG